MQRIVQNLLLCLGSLLVLGCGSEFDALGPQAHSAHNAIIGGSSDPAEMGISVPAYQQDAVVRILHSASGSSCSGTLIGEKLVLSAAHCAMKNVRAWWVDEEEPDFVAPELTVVQLGAAADEIRCELNVESIRVHPLLNPVREGNVIDYDFSLFQLTESVFDVCGAVLPVRVKQALPETAEAMDQLLIAGFGASNPEFTEYGTRMWTTMDVYRLVDMFLILMDSGHGMPAPGDSGGPVLLRNEAGTFDVVAVNSTVVGTYMATGRVDWVGDFIDASINSDDAFCTATGRAGLCADNMLFACTDAAFTATDCSAQNANCEVDSTGQASCAEEQSQTENDDTSALACSATATNPGAGLWLLMLLTVLRRGLRATKSAAHLA